MKNKIKTLAILIDEATILIAMQKRNLIAINSGYPQEAIDDNYETDIELKAHFNL